MNTPSAFNFGLGDLTSVPLRPSGLAWGSAVQPTTNPSVLQVSSAGFRSPQHPGRVPISPQLAPLRQHQMPRRKRVGIHGSRGQEVSCALAVPAAVLRVPEGLAVLCLHLGSKGTGPGVI